jgi:hypothetical protein
MAINQTYAEEIHKAVRLPGNMAPNCTCQGRLAKFLAHAGGKCSFLGAHYVCVDCSRTQRGVAKPMRLASHPLCAFTQISPSTAPKWG